MEVDTAGQILLIGAFLMLAVGIFTGLKMSQIRATEPTVPKYLTMAHIAGYQQAPILLGLVVAVAVSDLSASTETLGAALVTASAVLLATKELLNYSQEVKDEFAEKSLGYKLALVFGPLHVIGIAILGYGALTGF